MMFRCPECRTRRVDYTVFLRHVQESGHKVCNCGGYHFPHRANSPCCYAHPMGAYNAAKRVGITGNDLTDIFIDCAWDYTGKPVKPGDLCPF